MPKSRFQAVKVITSSSSTTPEVILRNSSRSIRNKLRAFKGSMKVLVNSNLRYQKQDKDGQTIYGYVSLNTDPVIFRQTDNINQFMKKLNLAIEQAYNEMNLQDTQFKFDRTMDLQLKLASFTPVSGSSYIPTPKFIEGKKATINVKNTKDNRCFLWSVLAHIHPVEKHPERLTNYKKYEDELDLTGLKFPIELKDIDKFEKHNPYAINVLGYDEEEQSITVIRVSELYNNQALTKKVERINLMLISDIVKADDQLLEDTKIQHYILVKNLSRLLSSQISNHKTATNICMNCLSYSSSNIQSFNTHVSLCKNVNTINQQQGFIDKTIKFEAYADMVKIPYTIYADFEAVLESDKVLIPNEDNINEVKSKLIKSGNTIKEVRHKPCGYMLLAVDQEGNIFDEKLFEAKTIWTL